MRELILFEAQDGSVKLNVPVAQETVWLTQAQMVQLFNVSKQNISLHIGNCFKEGELDEASVVKESLTTASDGKKYRVKYYNLDVIISVGYRVKSKRGVEFDVRLEEAARTIGASEAQAIFKVVIPTLIPVFISAAALSFYTSMSAFGTAFTLANQFEIIPIVMYNEFTLNFKLAAASAMAIVIGAICVGLNMLYRTILEKE